MKAMCLDALVEAGMLTSYEYEVVDTTNRGGDDIYYEKLVLEFPNGDKVRIVPSNTLLLIDRE